MSMYNSENNFLRFFFRFLSGTLISRITGVIREISMAMVWGLDPIVSLFWVSYRIIFFFRRIFGESVFHPAFIPSFEAMRLKNPGAEVVFFKKITTFFLCSTLAVILFGELFIFACNKGGYSGLSAIHTFISLLLPVAVFAVLFSINSAVLNCEKQFFISGCAPSIINIVWIFAIFWWRNTNSFLFLKKLCFILILGHILQWALTIPGINKFIKQKQRNDSASLSLSSCLCVFKPMLFGFLTISVFQINSIIDMSFGRLVHASGPSLLWYAVRVQQFPIAIIGMSAFAVILPSLSKAVINEDIESMKSILLSAIRMTITPTIIISGAFLIGGFLIISLIYGHGRFSFVAIAETTYVLYGYVLGLIPIVLCSIMSVLFYAKKRFKELFISALIAVIFNSILNLIFVHTTNFGCSGISIATALSSWVQLGCLCYFSFKVYKQVTLILVSEIKAILRCITACFLALFIEVVLFYSTGNIKLLFPLESLLNISIIYRVLILASICVVYLGALCASALVCKAHGIYKMFSIKMIKRSLTSVLSRG